MKIVLTGGGTGGHFYPLIAVVEEIENLTAEKKIVSPDLFFFAPAPYSDSILFDHKITFVQIPSGKMRRYFSFQNIIGILTTIRGFYVALWHLFRIYPDVVFGKGGYGSFPTLLAARLLFIPVVIHESDSKPGRVNAWAGKFAQYIAVSYPEASKYFKKDRVAWTGNPLRREILSEGEISKEDNQASRDALGLEKDIPVILVIGGSQGSQIINDALLDTLPLLLDKYQIIHQAGTKNFDAVKNQSEITLEKDIHRKRYKPFPYLTEDMMKKAYNSADLVISRAGSTIFEIAARGLPSIIIPIPESISHDQRTNAYNYKRVGGCVVIEEENLRPEIISAEIARIMTHPEIKQALIDGANKFTRNDAAKVIADILISIGLTHEK